MEYNFTSENRQQIFLRPDSMLSQHIIDELEELFASIPPVRLKQRIHQVYLWLQASNFDSPELYQGIAEDYILLFHFLDTANEHLEESEPQGASDLSGKVVYTRDLKAQLGKIRECVTEATEEDPERTIGQFNALLTFAQIQVEEARRLVR